MDVISTSDSSNTSARRCIPRRPGAFPAAFRAVLRAAPARPGDRRVPPSGSLAGRTAAALRTLDPCLMRTRAGGSV
ncbi:hypothetical protein GCM10010495_06200 [Kitasatospora herbaricolor]|nr:hypothetical protein GCM10010495_06200 [Kitasatospora herbaricolor]